MTEEPLAGHKNKRSSVVWALIAAAGVLLLFPDLRTPIWSSIKAALGGQAPTQNARHLESLASFCFRAQSGECTVFDMLGTVIKREPATDMRDCALRFAVLSANRGLILGNVGTGEVEVRKTGNSLLLIETTESGTTHVLTVQDEWVPEERGFRCTYVRNVKSIVSMELIRTAYSGFACPDL